MGKEPLTFSSKLPNALIIQGKVTNDEYNNFVNNEENKAKIKEVKTIYIEKDTEICCTFEDFSKVEKIVLLGVPKSACPGCSWLGKETSERNLDVSNLPKNIQTKGAANERWKYWGCEDNITYSKEADKEIHADSFFIKADI